MNASLKHLTLALLLVVLTVVSGPLVPRTSQTTVLGAGELLGETPEPALTVVLPEQSETLSISSQSEVLFFDLKAQAPFTLRYLTLALENQGLRLPEKPGDWKVYLVEEGLPHYDELVGYGEEQRDGFLRLRLMSSPAAGFFGNGMSSFALVAPIYKDGTGEAFLRMSFPKLLPTELPWEWAVGERSEPWLDLDAALILNNESIQGLPSDSVERKY